MPALLLWCATFYSFISYLAKNQRNSSVSFFVIGHFKMIQHYFLCTIFSFTCLRTQYLFIGAYLDTALKCIPILFLSNIFSLQQTVNFGIWEPSEILFLIWILIHPVSGELASRRRPAQKNEAQYKSLENFSTFTFHYNKSKVSKLTINI